MYDFIVIIGRFQPFHMGHLDLLNQAFIKSDNVIMLCGSANSPRSLRNPWTFEERQGMIRNSLSERYNARLTISPLCDHTYDDMYWVDRVKMTVSLLTLRYENPSIGLMGHYKDDTSYYLKLFPEWELIDAYMRIEMDATDIRRNIFEQGHGPGLPSGTSGFMDGFVYLDEMRRLTLEYESVKEYKKSWENSPYSPTFVTVDAILLYRGQVLMITRKDFPGKGLFALPGGFVNPNETLIDACMRELKEETCIDIHCDILKDCVRYQKTYDDPNRSSRGRTFTNAFLIDVSCLTCIPYAEASDDAAEIDWIRIGSLDPKTVFEDHYHIINNIIKGAIDD